MAGISATESSESAETFKAAESSSASEDVTEHGEDVIHVHAGSAESALSAHSGKSELVILLAFLRITQYIVCFSCLLELLLGLLVTRISVGVIFDGHLLVCGFYLCIRGILRYA